MTRSHSSEVVYRLYETVDELTTVIENARSVPMSGSCMVPRDHLLDLLDDLRESLPNEVQRAGRIVEQRTEILEQAQAEAERLTEETRAESEQLVASARRTRDEVLGMARRSRDELVSQAQTEAEELLTQADAIATQQQMQRGGNRIGRGRRDRDPDRQAQLGSPRPDPVEQIFWKSHRGIFRFSWSLPKA